jgi:hypothetical protein
MKKQAKAGVTAETGKAGNAGVTLGKAGKPPATKPPNAKKDGQKGQPEAVAGKAEGRFPRDPRNPFRQSSAYGICFDILAVHPDGLPKKEWIRLLAEAMGKAEKLAGYNCQVLMTAKPNADGSNSNSSPRHRACRPGFFITRHGDSVKLGLDAP